MVTLRFAEEITHLMLCDEDGVFVQIPNWATQCVYAGAVLMDLALENRIDSDPKRLTVIDRSPTGDYLLDSTLARIASDMEIHGRPLWGGQSPQSCLMRSGSAHLLVSSHATSCGMRKAGSCGYLSRTGIRLWMARPSAR